MSQFFLFNVHLILGYVAWILVLGTYFWPSMSRWPTHSIQKVLAAIHAFRFFGLVFILPGVVGTLPQQFATVAAYGDLATGLLAMAALGLARFPTVFWVLCLMYNVVGVVDLLADYFNAIMEGVPFIAGQMGAAYFVPVIYVPLLMLTHLTSFYLLFFRRVPALQHA